MWTRKRVSLGLALTLCVFVTYNYYKQISLVDKITNYARSGGSPEKSARYIHSTDKPYTETTEPNKDDTVLSADFDQKMRKFNMSTSMVDKVFELYKEVKQSSDLEKKQLSDFLYAMNIVDELTTTDLKKSQQKDLNVIRQSADQNENTLHNFQNDRKSTMNEHIRNQNPFYHNFKKESNEKQSLALPKTKGDDSVGKIFKADNSVRVSTSDSNTIDEMNKIGENNRNTSLKASYRNAFQRDFIMKMNKYLNAHRNETVVLRNQEKSSKVDNATMDSTEPSRPEACDHCFNDSFKMIINHSRYCKKFTDLNLLILIFAAPQDQNARMVIRNTWATLCTKESQIGFLFVLGKSKDISDMEKIKEENSVYHDIIQFSFIDAYNNLTYKTLSGLRWADRFCHNSKFVMKMDTDLYLNTELLPLLLQALPRENFLGGCCWGTSSPQRDINSKWYVSFRSYQGRFPPMCSGTGYILSRDLLPKLLNISSNIPFFHLEDVYVAICMQKLGVTPVNLYGFNNMMQNFEACAYRNEILTSHLFSNAQLTTFWNVSRSCLRNEQLSPSDIYKPIPLPYIA